MLKAPEAARHPTRQPAYPINPLFINRWSPRALSGEEISVPELMSFFEAARWAPSCYNNQPWRFIYACRGTASWEGLFNLLNEHNQRWAGRASALIVVFSKRTFDNGKPSQTHTFDAGAAWISLALQAAEKNWVAHGMQGFDYVKAKESLGIPDDYAVEAMIAIGRQGYLEDLPPDLQEKEFPSGRKKIAEFVFEGKFQP